MAAAPLASSSLRIKAIIFTTIYFIISLIFIINLGLIKKDALDRVLQKHEFSQFFNSIFYYFSKNSVSLAHMQDVMKRHYDNNKKLNLTVANDVKNIVLIIGESAQRGYLQVYGYPADNTPFFSERKNMGSLVAYTDTISPDTATNLSLKRVLNFSSHDSKGPWYDHLNILDLARLADYKSFWLSNQKQFNIASTPVSRAVASRADSVKYTQTSVGKRVDGLLLPLLKQDIDQASNKNLYVLHLDGSHIKYYMRYPDEFDKFDKTKLYPHMGVDVLDTQTVRKDTAEYLNSILYTDWVIKSIYEYFDNTDTLFIYLSDHGESIYDCNNMIGHGFTCKNTVQIPFIFIATDKFKTLHSDIWQRINQGKDKPFMSDDLPHLMADILGIQPLEYDPTKSPINEQFIPKKRISAGAVYEEMR